MSDIVFITHIFSFTLAPFFGGVLLYLQGKGSLLRCFLKFFAINLGIQIGILFIFFSITLVTCGGILIGITPQIYLNIQDFIGQIAGNIFYLIFYLIINFSITYRILGGRFHIQNRIEGEPIKVKPILEIPSFLIIMLFGGGFFLYLTLSIIFEEIIGCGKYMGGMIQSSFFCDYSYPWIFSIGLLTYFGFFIFKLYKTFTRGGSKSLEPKESNIASIDLMFTLSQADISNISSITFLPKNGTGFTIKTPNIKRLAVYITTKLEKSTFEAEELRKPFDYVVKHIQSDLSKTDFNLVQGKIEEFVKSGGEVKINRV